MTDADCLLHRELMLLRAAGRFTAVRRKGKRPSQQQREANVAHLRERGRKFVAIAKTEGAKATA
jgi:hypothetical protein